MQFKLAIVFSLFAGAIALPTYPKTVGDVSNIATINSAIDNVKNIASPSKNNVFSHADIVKNVGNVKDAGNVKDNDVLNGGILNGGILNGADILDNNCVGIANCNPVDVKSASNPKPKTYGA